MEMGLGNLKVSSEFAAGRHGIACVGEHFLALFGECVFSPQMDSKAWREYPLRRSMAGKEILRDLRPGECTLGDLFVQIHRATNGRGACASSPIVIANCN
jgi:hypothetical protein